MSFSFVWLLIGCTIGTDVSEGKNDSSSSSSATDNTGKVILHNGIQLPETWPPRYGTAQELKSMPLPYLDNPPESIPINVGRQLFVDDFLIESTDLERIYHQPTYHNENPVMEPTEKWEYNKNGPYAAPFSDGIWYDEKEEKFKMWYLTGAGPDKNGLRTAYAESNDGINWEKPNLNIVGNTNILDNTNRDAATVWLDKNEKDPSKRFKMFMIQAKPKFDLWPLVLKYSADGIHWSKEKALSGGMYDRTTVFHNPFLSKWVLSMKVHSPIGRSRAYLENEDEKMVVSLAHKYQYDTDIHDFNLNEINDANIAFWFGADEKDPRHPRFPDIDPQIYNHDAIAYESLMLGFFTVWQGPTNGVADSLGIQKRNEVLIGYSRDGFHWDRPSHKPFMGANSTEGAWNWGNVQSVAGTPIIKGDSLYFYVSGRRISKYMWDSYTSTGLAKLRRDGFASMESNGQGSLLTRNVSFDGKYLFVNVNIKGSLQIEVLDQQGNVIKGYSRKECISITGNSTKKRIAWEGENDLEDLAGEQIKFRFYIDDGELYSFWVSPWETGESRGYTSGGGPGLHHEGIDKP